MFCEAILGGFESRMDQGPYSTLAEPNRTILEAFGGGPVAAGVRVSELLAEGIPAVYGCVDILASTNAQIPLKLMRNLPDGGRQDDPQHPVYALLHDLANPEMTAFDFRTTMERWKLLWGNAYAEIERDRQGRPRALWPLRSDRMQVTRDNYNRLTYTYRMPSGSTKVYTFDPNQPPILHLRINSLDGVLGRSPIRVLREHIGFTLASSQYGQRFFNNAATPRGILTSDLTMTKDQRDVVRQSWNAVHQGVENSHKVAVLDGGLKFQAISIPPEDAQFIETVRWNLEEIAGRIYHVPGFMLGHTEKSTSWGTGLEQQAQGFVTFTLMPHLIAWSQAIARDLLSVKAFATHTAVFVTNHLVKADFKTLQDGLAVQLEHGVINADDWRAEIGKPPRGDEDGQRYWRPAANYTLGGEPPADPDDTIGQVPEPAVSGAGESGAAS